LIRRGKVFYASWTVAGKKFMRTTGKRDRREAEKELHRIMEPFVAGDEIATLQNIAARIEGRKADLARLENERNPPLTVIGAWSAYRTAPGRPDSGKRTLSDYEGYFGALYDWLKRSHPDITALRDVTTEMAGEYTAYLTGERKLSANSFNKHVRFLELLFRVLKNPARLTENPWEGIKRKKVFSESRRKLEMDELKAVCAAASGEMRMLFALGIYTGLRLGDAATLRWAEVDLRRQIIIRVPNKIARSQRKNKDVFIPIHPVLAVMFSELPREDRGEYVLPDTAALYLANPSALSKRIHDHFEVCGLKTHLLGTGEGTDKRAVVKVGFHSLRHTFVSLCRESNAPLSVVEAIVGHSNPEMTRLYTHVSVPASSTAVNALPSVIGESPTLPPAKPKDDHLRKIVERMTAATWKEDRARLLAILGGKACKECPLA
jgi:integrase